LVNDTLPGVSTCADDWWMLGWSTGDGLVTGLDCTRNPEKLARVDRETALRR
jgi:hypothetical protein